MDDAVVERRFTVSLQHFKLAIPLCDTVHIYDNSGESFRYVMVLDNGDIKSSNTDLPIWLDGIFEE